MAKFDPQITVQNALLMIEGSQADLARSLGVSRQSVTDWKKAGGMLPPLQGYRLLQILAELDRPQSTPTERRNHA